MLDSEISDSGYRNFVYRVEGRLNRIKILLTSGKLRRAEIIASTYVVSSWMTTEAVVIDLLAEGERLHENLSLLMGDW